MAEQRGLVIALENHVMTTLDSPERVRDVLSSVDSPAVRLNVDPVNFVSDLEALVELHGPRQPHFRLHRGVRRVRSREGRVRRRRLVVHISETFAGDGEFDLHTFFRRFEATLPDGYLFLEHLPEELLPRAKRHIDARAGGARHPSANELTDSAGSMPSGRLRARARRGVASPSHRLRESL